MKNKEKRKRMKILSKNRISFLNSGKISCGLFMIFMSSYIYLSIVIRAINEARLTVTATASIQNNFETLPISLLPFYHRKEIYKKQKMIRFKNDFHHCHYHNNRRLSFSVPLFIQNPFFRVIQIPLQDQDKKATYSKNYLLGDSFIPIYQNSRHLRKSSLEYERLNFIGNVINHEKKYDTNTKISRLSLNGSKEPIEVKEREKKKKFGSQFPIRKVCVVNKFARSNYEISDKLEAGIELKGTEQGPLCAGSGQLKDAYCRIKDGELWLHNCHISKHKTTGKYFQHEEKRIRKLLVHRKELLKLKQQTEKEGMTIVPLRIYMNAAHKIKVEIGVGKGKKKYDKRQDIKDRENKRTIQRAIQAIR